MTLQLQDPSFAGGISSFVSPLNRSTRRPVIRAKAEPSDKSVEIMRKFSEQYARKSGTYFCVDKGVTSVKFYAGMIQINFKADYFMSFRPSTTGWNTKEHGLADHKDSLGAPLCPCRHYDDKPAEAGQGFWNCPCVPMRERKECHCMLFLTSDNDFAGPEQIISLEEIRESTANM
ncbi:hypothetical protein C1H46_044016 [Malus baccata]|uniref:Ferredoxin-thioredoxin reductase catalytic chain, chloroplastic n=1 Tax=Malus baccata TaxID=106549 RepID=A0A540K8B4_MALBA|nr:hypothetical protein C1H46_044016 [Malus baccata]